MTAKISGCVLKQGSKTHSSLRRSNVHLQNQAALMSWRIWAVSQVCGWTDWRTPRFESLNLAKLHTRIENAIKFARKLSSFAIYRSPAKFYFSFFPAETFSNAW